MYISGDGFIFITPEHCLEYEKKRARWTAAMEEIPPPEGFSLDLSEWMPRSPYRSGTIREASDARNFLEKLAYLLRLAEFMAEE